jgi:short-subunit dehydrogenase
VNTASLAGLIPGPGLAPYDATKHAVVGLSLSLRAEAGGRGVKVSAICPGFVDTPLLGRVNPDLPPTSAGEGGNVSDIVGPLYKADLLAEDVLRGLAKNKPLIVAPRSARVLWRMTRYAPNLALNTITKTVQRRAGSQS